jgi:MFS family permease
MQEMILIGSSIGVIAVVLVSDAIGRKRTVFYSLVLAFLGVLITVIGPVPSVKYVGLVLWGSGADIAFAVAASYITEVVSERERPMTYVKFNAAFAGGTIANAVLFYTLKNWIAVLAIYYGLGFLGLALWFQFYV